MVNIRSPKMKENWNDNSREMTETCELLESLEITRVEQSSGKDRTNESGRVPSETTRPGERHASCRTQYIHHRIVSRTQYTEYIHHRIVSRTQYRHHRIVSRTQYIHHRIVSRTQYIHDRIVSRTHYIHHRLHSNVRFIISIATLSTGLHHITMKLQYAVQTIKS